MRREGAIGWRATPVHWHFSMSFSWREHVDRYRSRDARRRRRAARDGAFHVRRFCLAACLPWRHAAKTIHHAGNAEAAVRAGGRSNIGSVSAFTISQHFSTCIVRFPPALPTRLCIVEHSFTVCLAGVSHVQPRVAAVSDLSPLAAFTESRLAAFSLFAIAAGDISVLPDSIPCYRGSSHSWGCKIDGHSES